MQDSGLQPSAVYKTHGATLARGDISTIMRAGIDALLFHASRKAKCVYGWRVGTMYAAAFSAMLENSRMGARHHSAIQLFLLVSSFLQKSCALSGHHLAPSKKHMAHPRHHLGKKFFLCNQYALPR
jgi:hypothetical protein